PLKRLVLPEPLPPWLPPHDQLPPAPGVVPLALTSIVPLIVATPSTAMITGRGPTTRKLLPDTSVRLRNGTITTCGPLLWFCATSVGTLPHQLVIVAICAPLPSGSLVSIVVVPQLSVVCGCLLQLIGFGSKLLGANARQVPFCVGSLGQPSRQSGVP